VIPDSTCSNQWSLCLNLVIPALAGEAPSDGSSRLTQLLKVYAGDGTALSGPAALGWPAVHLSVSQEAATLLVQWGDGAANSRVLNGSVAPSRSHIAIVRDHDRLGEEVVSMGCCCWQCTKSLACLHLHAREKLWQNTAGKSSSDSLA
jgi:hypothetical protein